MLISVQYLRAFAAIMVVLTHISHKLNVNSIDMLEWFTIGHYGVDLFFIISGFIMCLTVDKKQITFRSFMTARFIRILPLYWLLTTVALAVFLIEPSIVNSSGGNTSILTSYFLLPTEDKFLIRNGWTLSYEFLFYIIFSAFLFSKNHKVYSSILLLSLVVFNLFVHSDSIIISFITSPLLIEFLLGMLAYEILKRDVLSTFYGGVLVFLSLAFLILLNVFGPLSNFLGRSLYAGFPMFLFFLGFVSLEKFMPKLECLYKVGMSSYSLYLLHPFLLSGVTVIFKLFGLTYFPILYMAAMFFISLVFGYLCYIFLESIMDNKIRSVIYKAKSYK